MALFRAVTNPQVASRLAAATGAYQRLMDSGWPERTLPEPLALRHGALRESILAVLESSKDSLRPIEVRFRVEQRLGRPIDPHKVVASLSAGAIDPGVPIVRVSRGRYRLAR